MIKNILIHILIIPLLHMMMIIFLIQSITALLILAAIFSSHPILALRVGDAGEVTPLPDNITIQSSTP
jgi:hypothetical protein